MAGPEVEKFLTHLAVDRGVSASTQAQALSALLFLYKQVLQVELPWLDNVVRARPSRRLSIVLTTAEVRAVLARLRPHLEQVKERHRLAIERGYDIRTVQELLGHRDVKTTQIYTHVMRKGAKAVRSPLDQ
jgi:site-specific recombinase XerD